MLTKVSSDNNSREIPGSTSYYDMRIVTGNVSHCPELASGIDVSGHGYTILFADILRARARGIRQATDYDYDHEHEDQGPAPPLYLSHMLVGAIPRVTVLLLFHFGRHDAIVIAVQITIFVKSRLC